MTTPKVTKQPSIAEISPHLICALCGGYLIDATTIVECLHSFCKTCIVRYLEASKYCPICEVLVHKTRPLQNIKLDHTLQDIVYKLVPGLFQDEMRRRREFYRGSPTIRSAKSRLEQQRSRIIYSHDEKFSVSLEFCPDGRIKSRTPRRGRPSTKQTPDRRYLLCPAGTTIALLKKFMKLKFGITDNLKVDVFHANGNVRDHYSLMDVAYIYSWKREGVLQLYYAVYKAPDPIPTIEVTEVKPDVIDEVKVDDNRPSSLFSKAALLSNRGVDGDFPHDLSPLELIAHVANDLSCYQEGRTLKRKAEEAQLYENDEERPHEIHIQKSIEHAIDLCSNGNITKETNHIPATNTVTLSTQSPLRVKNSSYVTSVSQAEVVEEASSPLKAVAKVPSSPSHTEIDVSKKLAKEKPKTVETASQCDTKAKKARTDSGLSVPSDPHSKSQSVPIKVSAIDNVLKPEHKLNDDSGQKLDKVDKNTSNSVIINNNNNTIPKPNTPNSSGCTSPLKQPIISPHPIHDKKTGNAPVVKTEEPAPGPVSTIQQCGKSFTRPQIEIPKVQTLESNLTLTNGHRSPDVAKQQTVSARGSIAENKD